ncbi:glycosyltransferase [Candidatus Daviesbacteria bacterium]|nr:glycosyltransferase [Candidatus Daviesbacteria bacterium]
MNYPLLSIVIVTRNSEKTLPMVLKSIKKQNFPKKKLEVLIIDGMSTDKTREIVKEFRFRLIDNPELGFVPGKHLGYLISKGEYLMYLDSDEEIENPDSLKNKISVFLSNKKIKAVTGNGYKNPKNFPWISHYLNEFGDPFSYFIYSSTLNHEFFLKELSGKYSVMDENNNFSVFDFSKYESLPLLEFVEMGGIIDLNYFKKTFPQIKKDPTLIAHFLNLLAKKRALIAITKNDPIIHYSVDSIKKYLNKISWRIRNNIYNKQTLALSGFEGREQLKSNSYKRYLFIPYSLSIIFPLIDAVYLSLTRRDLIFLMHPFLCIYTTFLIMYYYLLNLFGIKPTARTYGS